MDKIIRNSIKMKFRTDGIRAKVNEFEDDKIRDMGKCLAVKSGLNPIVVGRDTRSSGKSFFNLFIEGVKLGGGRVFDVGILPTPAISFLTKFFECDFGVQITASHNSIDYNGFKFFDSNGRKICGDVQRYIERSYNLGFDLEFSDVVDNSFVVIDKVEVSQNIYVKYLLESLSKKVDGCGKKIVIDCANGATSLIIKRVFEDFNFDCIFYNYDIENDLINEKCGSCYPEFICKRVVEEKAYLGVAFDGDGDRIILCDEKGNVIDGDQILTFLAICYKRKDELLKDVLVVTDYTNFAVDEYLKDYGINVVRVRNGDINVTNKIVKSGYNLGGEKSGHIILDDKVGSGDGILCVLKLLFNLDLNRNVSEQLSLVEMNPEILINIEVDFDFELESILRFGAKFEILHNLKRVFIRKSGTENKLRVLMEADYDFYYLKDEFESIIKEELLKCKQ